MALNAARVDPVPSVHLDYAHGASSRSNVLVAWLLASALGATDLITADINLSILYSLLLILFGNCGDRQLRRFAITVSVFAVAGFLIGPRPVGLQTIDALLTNYRMINRGFAVLSIVAVTYALLRWRRFRADREGFQPLQADPNHATYAELILAFQQWTAFSICIVLTVAIVAADVISPRTVNYPILYAAPLLVCLWVNVPGLIWIMLPILLGANLAGYFLSESIDPTANPSAILYNRLLAGTTTVVIAVVIYAWLKRVRK